MGQTEDTIQELLWKMEGVGMEIQIGAERMNVCDLVMKHLI